VFAFRPGHEEYPVFHQAEVRRVVSNAVAWATPVEGATTARGESEVDPIEPLED
jgi:trehalose utilization protein